MTAFLMFLTGAAITAGLFLLAAAALIYLANVADEARTVEAEREFAVDWQVVELDPDSSTPIHDALQIARARAEMDDERLRERLEGWGK